MKIKENIRKTLPKINLKIRRTNSTRLNAGKMKREETTNEKNKWEETSKSMVKNLT